MFWRHLVFVVSWAVIVLTFVNQIYCSNATVIQKSNATHVVANRSIETTDVSAKTKNKSRYFDWQKRDGTVESIEESVEEFEMEPIIEMTATPIINTYPTRTAAKQTIKPSQDNMPEMAFSEFRAPEQVGDVKAILWGESETTTTSLKNSIANDPTQPDHNAKSDVEVFNGNLAKTLSTITTTKAPHVTPTKMKLDVEVEEFDLATFDNAKLGAYNLSKTTTMSTLELVNLYSAEETTMHSNLQAKYMAKPPVKYVALELQPNLTAQLEALKTDTSKSVSAPVTTELSSEADFMSSPSSMDKIMASMPSIDEDHVRTFTPKGKKARDREY